MKKFTFLFVTFIALFSGVVALTFSISEQLANYHSKKQQIATELNFEERIMNAWEWVPFNTIGEEKVARWQQLEKEASVLYEQAMWQGTLLACIIVIFVISNLLYYRKREHKLQISGLVMVFSAMSFLYLGLQSPFMELEAFNQDLEVKVPIDINPDEIPFMDELKDIPFIGEYAQQQHHYDLDQTFEGRMYYLYQNKSILDLIKLLYTGGNFLVAILLIFFSIVFPLIKLFSSIIIFLNPHNKSAKKFVPIVVYMGKWSMPDVFVVSIFLAYFSTTNMNAGVDTASATLIGTYFFLSFVVLSILSGFILKKVVHHKSDSTLDYI